MTANNKKTSNNSYECPESAEQSEHTVFNANNNFERRSNDNGNDYCVFEIPVCSRNSNIYMRSGTADGFPTPSNFNIMKNRNRYDDANDYCNMSVNPGYSDNTCPINYRNACTAFIGPNASATRYVEGRTTLSNINLIINNDRYMDVGCDDVRPHNCTDNDTTAYKSSYIGNAPRFPIIQTVRNCDEDCQPSTSKGDKIDSPVMNDNGNTCEEQIDITPCKKLFTVDESTGGDSIISSLVSIVKQRQNSQNKTPKAQRLPSRRSVNSTSPSNKPIPPNVLSKKSSNIKSSSKSSLKNNETKSKKKSSSNSIYREVKDWIYEVPLYPGLEKEAKDKDIAVINDLIQNLYKLSGDVSSPGYDEKVRNEIDSCLNKIPIWHPGDIKELSGFKRSLVENLTQRVKNLNKKNADTDSSKRKPGPSAVTEVDTSLMSCNNNIQSLTNRFTNDPRDVKVKICIIEWLQLIYSKTKNNSVLKHQIFLLADLITFRISPLLNKTTNNYDMILKIAILNIMNDLPTVVDCLINRGLDIHDLAEVLANRLLRVQVTYIYGCQHTTSFNYSATKCNTWFCHSQRETAIRSEIKKCFEDARVNCNSIVIEEAGIILGHCSKITKPEEKRHAKNDIINLLVTSTNLSEAQAWNLATVIIKKVQKVLDEGKVCESSQTHSFLRSYTTSVYTSMEESGPSNYPLTSTPKKKRIEKVIPKLNPQEVQYMQNVAKLIRAWMNTLPESFTAPEEQDFKETMINDLAGDIMDEAKLEQLAPDPRKDKRDVRKYIVCRWIFRLGVFEFKEVDKDIEHFLDKLQEIPAPIMTQPQHGNRQAMENLKFYQGSKWTDNFVPKGTDVLEDEISIWMHEQPSNIYANNDQKFRHDKIHELAQVLGNKLNTKRSQKEVSKDISTWLNQVVRSEKKSKISKLTENLKKRVICLPQDATLVGIVKNRSKIREEHRKSKLEYAKSPKPVSTSNDNDDESADLENTMAIFILKFIEHHYDIDDPLARRAFNRLLNSHLLSLNPPTRKEVYDNFENNEDDDRFPSRKVIKELEYIKDISDWLKNLPLDATYNTLGNRERIDFVNSLALSIREVEDDRENNPCAMDYEMYMSVIILEHMKLLPIPNEFREYSPFMIAQLLNKILAHRQDVSDTVKINESNNTSGVNSDNIGDFIEEFIRINGDDIAHDEVKMEVWAIRLIRELKKIVPNSSRPSELSKAHIYNKLTNVRTPGDETVMYFNLELDYVKEITNWMKNLPLIPMNNSEKDNATDRICQLAERMAEMDRQVLANPQNNEIKTDFKEYVAKWISELPLDRKKEIVLPVIIQQLMNRMEKLKQNDGSFNYFNYSETTLNKNEKRKTSIFKPTKENKQPFTSNLIDAVEKWSHALPIKAENDNDTINIKDEISRKLLQEVGQLNTNPTVNNDDVLYEDKLGDKISNILNSVPQNEEFQNKKDKLQDDIVNTILAIKNNIKEKTAGVTYKLELERTIDSSIPNPIPCYKAYDPGFEIYKDRLASAFILENFDHGADELKTKYETLLKKEIDKYFNHARNRNATPLTKDQLYNELYSALFKVPIPNEASVIDEVEKVKTRCDVDAWFEELPMREANGLSELLDWDKILSTLATRIHEIEKAESKPDNKIFKEIMKWLVQLPLQPGNENKLEEFATALQNILKTTADQRKCVLENSKSKNKKHKGKANTKALTRKSKEDNQLPSGKNWSTLPQTRSATKNSADEIYDIVQTWCNQLPINANDQEYAHMLKDDITTRMIIKISELNTNPEIFNDDVLYDELLGEELESLLSSVRISCSFSNSKVAKICQIKENVKSIKPQIVNERDCHKYKQDLHHTVDKILDRTQNLNPEKQAYLDKIRGDIVDGFVQYKYSNDDDEDKQGQKLKLQDNVSQFSVLNTNDFNKKEPKNNTLMKTNQLMSELAKILPKSKKTLRGEVEEIRMKKEIADFFDETGVSSTDVTKVNYLKENLAKKLNSIEMNGYDLENENNMKQEIIRCLKKLGKDINPTVIGTFLRKLKNNEIARRMPQDMAKDSSGFIEHGCHRTCSSRKQSSRIEYPYPSTLSSDYNIPANFVKREGYPYKRNRRTSDHKTVDFKNETSSQRSNLVKNNAGEEDITEALEEKDIADLRGVEDEEAMRLQQICASEDESSFSDDDDEPICLCKTYGGRHKRRPYCMIPIPIRYICERNNVMNALWCGMLPLF